MQGERLGAGRANQLLFVAALVPPSWLDDDVLPMRLSSAPSAWPKRCDWAMSGLAACHPRTSQVQSIDQVPLTEVVKRIFFQMK